MLVDGAGIEVARAVRPTPFRPTPAGVEVTVDDLLAAVAGGLAELAGSLAGVRAVGVAGLAESGAPLDEAGIPLGPVIAWHDPRGGEVVAVLQERFGDRLAAAIGQPVRTVSSVAKLGWQAAHGVAGVRWWLGVPELCLHRLTGERATDFSLAARTGAYDVARRVPRPDVVTVLGLPVDVFAVPSPAGAAMGAVSSAGAAWSGLPAGIPVTVAGHDHLVAMVGAGASAGDLGNSTGTAETVVGRSAAALDGALALVRRVAVTLWPDGEGWAAMASGARAGLVLAMAAEALGASPGELDRAAEGAPCADASGWVDGLADAARAGTPPPAAGPPPGRPGEVWNGVLHALAGRTADAVSRVEAATGPGRRLIVFGGGSRSRPWLAAKAAACRLPVVRSTALEPAARGAALFAGVAAGWWASPASAPAAAVEPV